MRNLTNSIANDISSLDERPVIQLIKTLAHIKSQPHLRISLIRAVDDLLNLVHGVVSDMAIENSDLVETTFMIDYLDAISPVKDRLNQDKTQAFVDMFRAKCLSSEGEQEIRKRLQQSKKFVFVLRTAENY